jgi:phospholipid/cholesterol/gamma-HCH transport system ATP-binding protein
MLRNKLRVTPITVKNLTMAYDDFVVMRDLDFTIKQGDIFFIIGGSGCGKTTLLNHMIGLKCPEHGQILYNGVNFWDSGKKKMEMIMRKSGILYQSGALWSSMTLAENVALPLQLYTNLSKTKVRGQVEFKLSLVGLTGFEDFYPAEISGGMRKRAGLARAIALDPEILFFDEPSAGLDPISSRRLDELIIQLKNSLNATVVIVSHELASIFAIATNSVFLDSQSRTMLAVAPPKTMLAENNDPTIQAFLRQA